MKNENIKELIKYEYENGSSISVLANKYNQKVGTIKSWISREKWKKKEMVATTKKKKPNKKSNQLQMVANEKEIGIKKDFLNGASKEEIMAKYGIKKSAYYEKSKSARELRKQKTEEYLNKIVDEVYPDLDVVLNELETTKRNIIMNTKKEIENENVDFKKIENLKKAYDTVKGMYIDLIRTGKMVSHYELLEIDKQLKEEELQQEKIDIERNKNQVEEREIPIFINDLEED